MRSLIFALTLAACVETQAPQTIGAPCNVKDDCGEGLACVESVCVSVCEDYPCGEAQICATSSLTRYSYGLRVIDLCFSECDAGACEVGDPVETSGVCLCIPEQFEPFP
jgi:hypothetical protein